LDRTGAIPLQVTLSKIGVSASVAANRSDPNRPTLTNASLDAHATFGGTTFTPSHTVDFTLTRSANGTLTGNISVTALGFNVPGLGVGLHLDGTLIVKLFPYSTDFDITVPGTQMTANGSLVYAVVYFGGKITAKFPQPLGTVTIPTSPSLIGGLPIPVPPKIGELLALQSGSIPLRWPPAGSPADPAGKAQLPPAGTDFAGSAKMLEGGIAQHVPPNNAVLSLDYTGAAVTPKPGKPGKPAFTYGVDADSTIWTGHYLAAEAFRYAATKSDESLARVQQLIQGLQRDFDVTSDAVIQDHRYTAVPASERGVFARSAIPDSGTLWTDPPAARINRGECLYVKPTGGWRAGAKTYPTYAAAKASPVARAIQPVGPIWYGSGCGNRGSDHPISRDQYSGIFMGLAYAWALVPSVQPQVKQLIDEALGYLTDPAHPWDVPLPPDGSIITTFAGEFDSQLALLRVGATIDPARFGAMYSQYAPASELAWIPIWFSTFDPVLSYFKFNLGHAFIGPALFLETNPTLRNNFLAAYNILRAPNVTHRNAWFDAVDILAGAASASSPSASNPSLTFGQEIQSDLAGWIARWHYTGADFNAPNQMPRNATSTHAATDLAALWPKNEVKLYTNTVGDKAWLSTYPLPPEDRTGDGMDFSWQKSPFSAGVAAPGSSQTAAGQKCSTTNPTPAQIKACSSDSAREGPAVDYLLPYWVAVYLHLL
jgi:hypothetical protein